MEESKSLRMAQFWQALSKSESRCRVEEVFTDLLEVMKKIFHVVEVVLAFGALLLLGSSPVAQFRLHSCCQFAPDFD